jgi:hypothetical protein
MPFDDLWSSLRSVEQRVCHTYRQHLYILGEQFEALHCLLTVVPNLYQADDAHDLRYIVTTHIAKCLTSFQGALTTVIRTLFSESSNLVRVGLETAWQMLYLVDHPDEREKWLSGGQIKPIEVRKGLPLADERYKLYTQLCNVSHANKEGMDYFVSYMNGYVKSGPHMEPFYVRQGLYHIHLFMGWIIEEIVERFYGSITEEKRKEADLPDILVVYSQRKSYHLEFFQAIKEEIIATAEPRQ